jgi:phosphoribosylaminoimidazolecarboxamide formyltransferase / IMP cyclohydrolase
MTSDFLNQLPEVAVERALISVSDKSGLPELVHHLHDAGIQLISTGGTARLIRESGIPVTDVSDITGFPECLDGRVKTLHPRIHGGLLARPGIAGHARTLEELGINPIQLVIVNLYPFREAVQQRPGDAEHAIENIDIGGPAMVRASAKNFENVCVVTDPGQYMELVEELTQNNGKIRGATRAKFAVKAFQLTASYDRAISGSLGSLVLDAGLTDGPAGHGKADEDDSHPSVPAVLDIHSPVYRILRYGENPHQPAAIYGDPGKFIDCFHGKELSYNNYLDIDAALNLGTDFRQGDAALCAIFKHSLPCGVALSESVEKSWEKAFSTDTTSPFGGIVLFNRPLDGAAARKVDQIFTEIILAPSYTEEALELLKQKSNRRLIRILDWPDGNTPQVRSVTGGYLFQQADSGFAGEKREVVTRVQPGREQMETLEFAWIVAKHVKSNAIVYAHDRQTIGIGTGQPNRVTASRIAAGNAKEYGHDLMGCVVASDAFFPFADGLVEAARAGASAVIQPGGSVRDDEVIAKADELGIAMIFTGARHFRH